VTLGAVETLSAAERASLADAVGKLEAYMQGPAATAIARRYLFWQSLRASAAQYGISPTDVVSDALVSANTLADRNAQSYARLLRGLGSGELKLAAWTQQGESAQPMQLGIVRADVQPGALGQWQILPVVARVVGQVTVAAGAWILANAWTTSRELEAQADKTRAETSSQITQTIAALAKQDPARATALANALAAASKAASQGAPGILDQLASSVQDITGTVRDVGTGVRESSSLLVLLGILYLLGKRRTNPSGRRALPAPRARSSRNASRNHVRAGRFAP
jgi:hypothetical protein